MNILVTGGAGYIGSHTIVELIKKGHSVVIVDNFVNSSVEMLRRLEKITQTVIPFYNFDLRDSTALHTLFKTHQLDAVVHFAGLKAVGESVQNPLLYYQTNLDSTLALLETMAINGVYRIVFSSSATVYGSAPIPYTESSPSGTGITNPYGRTKYFIEQILEDITKVSESRFECTVLRYFNPIGAHESGMIGEDPQGLPNNLMPYITQVATGVRKELVIFGNDYPTVDGTGVRDYIHVIDLAEGHVAALENSKPGFSVYNLGSGQGTSVLELVRAFEETSGKVIPYTIGPRREGDLPEYYANPSKAYKELGWQTKKTIKQACEDSWRWQRTNPNGLRG